MNFSLVGMAFAAEDPAASGRWFAEHFGFRIGIDIGWYVNTQHPSHQNLSLDFVKPERFAPAVPGGLVAFLVEDVDAEEARLREAGLDIVLPLTTEPWGQRRFQVAGPDSVTVEVLQMVAPDPHWLVANGFGNIQTEHLELRPLTREESQAILDGDREGRNWAPGYPRDDDKDVARLALSLPEDSDPWFGPLQIVLRESGEVIGAIGFFGPPDASGTTGLGYGVAPGTEGRGYTTEALKALLEYGFSTGTLNRAIADTDLDNIASQRVLEKAGMRRIATDDRLHYYEIVTPRVRTS